SRRRHTSFSRDWSSDVCSSGLGADELLPLTPRSEPAAELGIAGLRDVLGDAEFGGWLAARGEGEELVGTKEAYAHAFVVLAASTGKIAGVPGAAELLTDALAVLDARCWEPEQPVHLAGGSVDR